MQQGIATETVKMHCATVHFLLLAVASLVLRIIWKFGRILLAAYRLPSMPGYPAYPIIGHIHYITYGLIGMTKFIVRHTKEIASLAKSTTVVWWRGMPFFLVFDPDDIQTVLNSSATSEKGPEILAMKYALGDGILTAPWKYWRVLRRNMNPLFHPRNLNHLVPVVNACARDLTLNLSRHVETGHVDVLHHVCDAALASTSNLLFGPDFKVNVGSKSFRRINESIDRISTIFGERFMTSWLWSDFLFKIFYRREIHEMEMSFKEYFQDPLTEFESRRKLLHEMEIPKDENGYRCTEKGVYDDLISTQLTLVDVYIQLQQTHPHLTKTELRKEIFTMMLAGSDTTKVTVSSCLLALSSHPEIQEKLYAEVVSVMGNVEEDVTMEHLKIMTYLDQVVKETLRWFLVIPMISRKAQQDLKLKSMTVPAGSTVGLGLSTVHYDPRYYPNPERFDPDHFLPERVAARPKYTFVPFSGGPRGCIGKNYSMMTVKTLIVHVLSKYKLSTDMDIDSLTIVPGLAFSYLEGYRIKLQHR